MKITKKFVATPPSGRIWVSMYAPGNVLEYLRTNSKWGGSDKLEGERLSFEISREIPLAVVRRNLTDMGMVDCTGPAARRFMDELVSAFLF
jgi:hypothetical protein